MDKKNRKELVQAYKERKIIGGVYAIKNTINGKMLLESAADLQGNKNRFEFSQKTDSCINIKLQKDWKELGGKAFVFDILETLEKKDTQTLKEFSDDIQVLEEMWAEKIDSDKLY